MNAVKLNLGDDGILVARMDLPGRPMNVVGDELMAGIAAALDKLADPAVKGLILSSAKADFCAGGDIDRMSKWTTPQQPFDASMAMKAVLRRLELQGKPVVAAINGHALGGGLELALACHTRIALDDPRLKIGQPEVKLGLLPGGGGTVRLPRLVGMQQALQIMAEGNDLSPAKALAMGLLSAVAPDADALLDQARAWIAANPKARQPWDQPKFRFPGGDSRSPAMAQMFAIAPSVAAAKSWGNYPAVGHIMSSVFEGGLLDFDAASMVESRYFAACCMSAQSRNMIGTLWYQLNAIKKGASRPQGVPRSKVAKLGILGAGMMGAGIAYVSAKVGIEVVLLDTTQEAAERGKAYSQGLLDKAVKKGRSTADKRDALLARITPTTDYALLRGCDLVIEAVFEDRATKADVTRKAEAQLGPSAVFASNTSTLPITGLAQASNRPANFIGLHFFSPVDKMPLVEIIVGAQTSDETLARGFDYVLQIGKTPIVVNDSRGFYTSRVFGTYVMEGAAMLAQGVPAPLIEHAAVMAGMPVGPLEVLDATALSLSVHVLDQIRSDFAAEGRGYQASTGELLVERMVKEFGRHGRAAGAGYYDYPANGPKRLWPGLKTHFEKPFDGDPLAAQEAIKQRLLYRQAIETARCLQEGVLMSSHDANIGSIFGIGFPAWTGGALQFVYSEGLERFVANSQRLADQHGDGFVLSDAVVKTLHSYQTVH
jgi:3-hydroxyacyl-CoA dehydrogenase/enoyl-CoA hydratase/3-hydroxybutyryl-CoA epimerase